jgi:hypothetical protein
MESARHAVKEGPATGRAHQLPGKHRFGIEMIPLGDRKRERCNQEEERGGPDISSSRKR